MQQRQKQSVILVGMMASGKSTVGAELARRLGWDFFDTDEVIAKEKGKPVGKFFILRCGGKGMIDTIQTAGPYVLAFWFGVAFGFCVCAVFAGRRR